MNDKKQVTAIKFKNFTDQDFTWSWDGVPYVFQKGQEMYMEDYKAHHFAKHLIDRELNKANIVTSNQTARTPLLRQCLPADEPVTAEQAINIEETKKVKKTKKVEQEFPDLHSNLK